MKLFLALVALVLVGELAALAPPAWLAAPAGAAASAPGACGARLLKADGTAWRCSFDDEFSGTALDRTRWLPQTDFSSGWLLARPCYVDNGSTVSVTDGSLHLDVRRWPVPLSCGSLLPTDYVAGMVTTYHLFSQQYGRFEARMRTTDTTYPGLHEAFWLWPDDRVHSNDVWPNAGEIDVSETYSLHPDLSIPFLHYSADSAGPQPGVNTAWDCVADRGAWNTYTVEWSPDRIEIFVNHKSCLVNTSGDRAFQKPYIVALTAGLGTNGNEYDGRAPLPATTDVDYVRVWR